ncbi:pentapeptide repeat-containing protein [Paenibacillus dauci]|uniref:pentapeptide repeat-containing protein n=1 Tax=Paenibacillus dauci TaxID=1567106 RepID=UPI000619C87F|nr:pentapeptide repeat-containing protein [Paenibacillus dauci]
MLQDKEITVNEFLGYIRSGQKNFYRIEVLDIGEVKGEVCDDIVFKECGMAVDFSGSSFRNAKFIDCNIKTCSFKNTNLTNAEFIGNGVCSVEFYNAQIEGILFQNNYWHSFELTQRDIMRMVKEEFYVE